MGLLVLAAPPVSAGPSPARIAAGVAVAGAPPEEAASAAFREVLRQAVNARPDLALLPEDAERRLFASPIPPSPEGALRKAERLLRNAKSSLDRFDLDAAEKLVLAARELLDPHVGLRATAQLDLAGLELAIALAHARRDDGRVTRLLREHTLRHPGAEPTRGVWPPDLMRRLEAAQIPAQTRLEVSSAPPGKVWVDGREAGTTPLSLTDLAPGRHRVEVEAPGHFPRDTWVETSSAEIATAHLELLPALSALLRAAGSGGSLPPEAEAELVRLASAAGLEVVLLAAPLEQGRWRIRRLDLGEPKHARAAEVEGDPAGARSAVAQLFDLPAAVAGPGAPRGSPLPWVGAGSGALAVGAGVALRFLAVSTQGDLEARRGALTQSEAFGLRDRGAREATGGTVLIGVGAAFLLGAGALWLSDWVGDGP